MWSFWAWVIWGLASDSKVLNYVRPVALLLKPGRGSNFRYLAILMVVFSTTSLLGNLTPNCLSLLGLSIRNCILNECGKCLLCCINLAICSQVLISSLLELVCHPRFGICIRFVLLEVTKHVIFFGLLWQCLLPLTTCLCIGRSLFPGFFYVG